MAETLLVVEDDRELRDLLRRYLERAGYTTHTTGSGAEAIRVLTAGGVAWPSSGNSSPPMAAPSPRPRPRSRRHVHNPAAPHPKR